MPRLIRWTGQGPRYRHATDAEGYGLYDDETGKPVFERDPRHEATRQYAWPGISAYVLSPVYYHGLSREYRFGTHEHSPWATDDVFVVEMSDEDWAIVSQDRGVRENFLDVTDFDVPAAMAREAALLPNVQAMDTEQRLNALAELRRGGRT